MAALAAAILFPTTGYCGAPEVGQQERWKASFRAELQQQGGGEPSGVTLSGEWVRTVVAVRKDDYDVQFQFASVTLEGNRGKKVDPNELRLVQERLSKPFWVTCGNDGALHTIHFLKDVSPSDRNLLQMIATESQFVQADGTRPVWTSLERDGGGSYLAIYQQTDASHFRKKKLKYVDSEPGQKGSVSLNVSIEESETKFAFMPDGAVSAVDGVQKIGLSLPGEKGESLATRTEIHLGSLRESLDPSLASSLAMPKGLDDLPITTHQPDPKVAQEQMDQQLLAGQGTEEILTGAAQNDPSATQRLAALFRRRPESIPLAVARLTVGPGAQIIASGLAQSGADSAIQALRGVALDRSRVVPARVSALIALAGLKDPSVDVMRTPTALMNDGNPQIREAARLASGALARAGRSNHAAESDAIDATLAASFAKAATAEEKKQLLGALGNSAGPRAERLLRTSLKDGNEDMRAAATRGLRLVPGAEIDALLAKTGKEDNSATVRGAALFAMGFRLPLTETLWNAVLIDAKFDPAESVRNRAISLLRNERGRATEAEAALEWIAEHDGTETVRRFASESLAEIRANAARR
jgi:hypothetical protein